MRYEQKCQKNGPSLRIVPSETTTNGSASAPIATRPTETWTTWYQWAAAGQNTSRKHQVWATKDVNSKKGDRLNHEVGLQLLRQPKELQRPSRNRAHRSSARQATLGEVRQRHELGIVRLAAFHAAALCREQSTGHLCDFIKQAQIIQNAGIRRNKAHLRFFGDCPNQFNATIIGHTGIVRPEFRPIQAQDLEFIAAGLFGEPRGERIKWTGDSYRFGIYGFERDLVIIQVDGSGHHVFIVQQNEARKVWTRSPAACPRKTSGTSA